MKIRAPNSSMQNQQPPICISTLKHPKWVKLGTLFINAENKPKENFLLQQARARTQNKNSLARKRAQRKQKHTGLPPVKRFLYSHIARLHTLVLL